MFNVLLVIFSERSESHTVETIIVRYGHWRVLGADTPVLP